MNIDYLTGLVMPSGAIIEATYQTKAIIINREIIAEALEYNGVIITYPCGTKRFISNSWYD